MNFLRLVLQHYSTFFSHPSNIGMHNVSAIADRITFGLRPPVTSRSFCRYFCSASTHRAQPASTRLFGRLSAKYPHTVNKLFYYCKATATYILHYVCTPHDFLLKAACRRLRTLGQIVHLKLYSATAASNAAVKHVWNKSRSISFPQLGSFLLLQLVAKSYNEWKRKISLAIKFVL